MSALPRINPRRPFIITGLGRKRYALGQASVPGHDTASATGIAATSAASKPVRLQPPANSCIMVATHTERGLLSPNAQQAVAAAAILADTQCAVLLVVFGPLAEDAAPYGADRIIVLPDATDFHPDQELDVLTELKHRHQPIHLIMADTDMQDADLGRRLAAAHGLSIATHVVELTASGATVYQQQKAIYARRPLPDVMLLDADCVDTRLPFLGCGEILSPTQSVPQTTQYRDQGITAVPASHLSLEEADFIVSAGNGVRDLDGFNRLADVLGAAIGASRVAVDDGRFTREQQVGATGKTVTSSVYIALGISGAVQHLQGIKDCRHVIAVNTDSSAPMIKRADLSVIDDAQALIPALLAEVDTARHDTSQEARQ